jgi:hypothetical protein
MREVTIDGITFQVNPLKRKEIKELKKQGFKMGAIDNDQMDDWIDKLIEISLPGRLPEIDDLPPRASYKIFEAILKESFGDKTEEKN